MNETMTLTENPSIAKRDTVRLTTAPSCLRFQSCNTTVFIPSLKKDKYMHA